MYLVNGNKKNWYPGIFPDHDNMNKQFWVMNPVMHSLYSLQKAHLEYSYPCDIIDTGQGCKAMNLGCKPLVWWNCPWQPSGYRYGTTTLFGREFPQHDHIWSWDTPLVREYNYQAREYCVFYYPQISVLF